MSDNYYVLKKLRHGPDKSLGGPDLAPRAVLCPPLFFIEPTPQKQIIANKTVFRVQRQILQSIVERYVPTRVQSIPYTHFKYLGFQFIFMDYKVMNTKENYTF
jgi:hypothetical protein